MSEIYVTDDFKIMTNRAILAIKDKDKESFENAIRYIFKNIKDREIDVFTEYLFNKIISEVE